MTSSTTGWPATVDSITDGIARILVGEHPPETYTVDAAALPDRAGEGSALRIEGPLTEGLPDARLSLDPEATAQRRGRVQEKLARLRERGE